MKILILALFLHFLIPFQLSSQCPTDKIESVVFLINTKSKIKKAITKIIEDEYISAFDELSKLDTSVVNTLNSTVAFGEKCFYFYFATAKISQRTKTDPKFKDYVEGQGYDSDKLFEKGEKSISKAIKIYDQVKRKNCPALKKIEETGVTYEEVENLYDYFHTMVQPMNEERIGLVSQLKEIEKIIQRTDIRSKDISLLKIDSVTNTITKLQSKYNYLDSLSDLNQLDEEIIELIGNKKEKLSDILDNYIDKRDFGIFTSKHYFSQEEVIKTKIENDFNTEISNSSLNEYTSIKIGVDFYGPYHENMSIELEFGDISNKDLEIKQKLPVGQYKSEASDIILDIFVHRVLIPFLEKKEINRSNIFGRVIGSADGLGFKGFKEYKVKDAGRINDVPYKYLNQEKRMSIADKFNSNEELAFLRAQYVVYNLVNNLKIEESHFKRTINTYSTIGMDFRKVKILLDIKGARDQDLKALHNISLSILEKNYAGL